MAWLYTIVLNSLCVISLLGFCSGVERIYNGEVAKPNAYPWAVYLGYRINNSSLQYYCGGSLVAKRFVLTAAHCYINPNYVSVSTAFYLGDHNRTLVEGTEKTIGIIGWALHPDWDRTDPRIPNDIALVYLSEAVNFTAETSPIDILRSPKYHDRLDATGRTGTVAGWGYNKYDTGWALADVLQTLSIRFLSDQVCAGRRYSTPPGSFCYEAAKEVCAGSCNGDSGSGIFARRKGANVLVGVVSHGKSATFDGCASGVKGGAKVADFHEWIDSYLQNPLYQT